MFLLDTDLLSQTVKAVPVDFALTWLAGQSRQELWISVITLQEIQIGLEAMPAGKRRVQLEAWFQTQVIDRFRDRIIVVDSEIARESGRLLHRAKMRGHTASLSDALIAATARMRGLQLATLNRKHYLELEVDIARLE